MGGGGNEALPAHTFWQWRPVVIFLGEKDARDMVARVAAAVAAGDVADFDDWARSWGGNARCLLSPHRLAEVSNDLLPSQPSGQFIDVPAKSAKWPHGKCTPVTAISIWSVGDFPFTLLLELQVSGCVDNLKKPVHTPCRT